jgi:hypothetical protein
MAARGPNAACRSGRNGHALNVPKRVASGLLLRHRLSLSRRAGGLCSGLNMYQLKPDAPRFALGGLEIIDLTSNQAIYQVPVELWTESGLPTTYNPFGIEATNDGLRAYFMPEDEKSTLYIYKADVK